MSLQKANKQRTSATVYTSKSVHYCRHFVFDKLTASCNLLLVSSSDSRKIRILSIRRGGRNFGMVVSRNGEERCVTRQITALKITVSLNLKTRLNQRLRIDIHSII